MSDEAYFKLLDEAVNWCREQSVADGAAIVIDHQTANILVHRTFLGFCISLEAVKDDLHKTQFEPCMQRLKEVEEGFPHYAELMNYVKNGPPHV